MNQKESLQEKRRDQYLRRTYGIKLDQFREILRRQGGMCRVCLRSFEESSLIACVDHSHRHPKYIRGILCSFCNLRVVGRHTDGDLLSRAGQYLKGPFTEFIVPDKKKKKRKKRI